ncbi:NADPH-dependent FMN reductase [Methanolacinia petrolearia DSM 11571]|uniref:NADPH-dependent FMN reductase n=1 Tax=Methanolacinia petrolearia (strain DSM 11571 / OCM 486 / SEBR 4847) TaxID=679926 RepID=E1RF19_METP4|nr:flavodoxin family protein [Methanolacinia petrolearia]ADN37263.1 NADPH-dependent FMN reductase [Methanolacinia petrolearia DSM 11571]
MKVIAVNGSPRKNWNTATLLKNALEGAASNGAETELVHLYDLDYTGCTSCFACKLKSGKSYGRCAINDELESVLEKIAGVDALVIGSPVYFGDVTGAMRSFLERLFFQYLAYTNPPSSLFGRDMKTAAVYTMNAPEKQAKELNYDAVFGSIENVMVRIFGSFVGRVCSYETLQFEDYDKMVFDLADPGARRERHRTVFPEDCKKALELGKRLASPGGADTGI